MSRRMLIVDDEETIRWALRELFMADGWEVHCAGDGDEAGRLTRESAYDFIITDLKLPGLSGAELIRQTRCRNPDAGLIVLTGYASVETAVEAVRLHAWDYVTKPCEARYLRERVAAFFSRNSAGAQPHARLGPDDLRRFLDGEKTAVFAVDSLHADDRSLDALGRLRRLFAHLGIAPARVEDLVQMCGEGIALAAGGNGGARAEAGLLGGCVIVALRGAAGGLDARAVQRAAEQLEVHAAVMDDAPGKCIVVWEGL